MSACSSSAKARPFAAARAALAALLLALPAARAAAATPAQLVAQGQRLQQMLIEQGILKDDQIAWAGTTFDVSSHYQLCPSYHGICYKALETGFDDPIILAVYEITPGQLDITQVDYLKYKKDRSSNAKSKLMAGGRSEAQVYKLSDASGAALFDSWGQLTKAGETYYENMLDGSSNAGAAAGSKHTASGTGTANGPATKRRVGHGDDVRSRYTINELLRMGYREITARELDCLHRIPLDDDEIMLEKVAPAGKLRYFLNIKDPSTATVARFRRDGSCRAGMQVQQR